MAYLSAFFESMSGWTGTGLTMVGGGEANLPYTLQFWRSLIQWVGGVGVIVLTLSILARPGTGSFVLYKEKHVIKKRIHLLFQLFEQSGGFSYFIRLLE